MFFCDDVDAIMKFILKIKFMVSNFITNLISIGQNGYSNKKSVE